MDRSTTTEQILKQALRFRGDAFDGDLRTSSLPAFSIATLLRSSVSLIFSPEYSGWHSATTSRNISRKSPERGLQACAIFLLESAQRLT